MDMRVGESVVVFDYSDRRVVVVEGAPKPDPAISQLLETQKSAPLAATGSPPHWRA